MIENLNIYFSDEEKDFFPEKFSISSLCSKREEFNCNLSNIGNIDETNEQQNPSPLNNSIGCRLLNLEKLLDQELSQSQEDPVKEPSENTTKTNQIDKNDIRLSKMNEKEAALYYENRRKELFKGFTQQTKLKSNQTKNNVHNENAKQAPNLKEFIVYNKFPQKKTLKKCPSTSYPSSFNNKLSKPTLEKKQLQITENPSQTSTAASSSKLLKELSKKKKELPKNLIKKTKNDEPLLNSAKIKNIMMSNEKSQKKPDFSTPIPSVERLQKKPPPKYNSEQKIMNINQYNSNKSKKNSEVRKTLVFERKKVKVLTIDLKDLKRKITAFTPSYYSLKNMNAGKIVKNNKASRECSLILEEGVKRIEEDFNRSRSFSFNSYGNPNQ